MGCRPEGLNLVPKRLEMRAARLRVIETFDGIDRHLTLLVHVRLRIVVVSLKDVSGPSSTRGCRGLHQVREQRGKEITGGQGKGRDRQFHRTWPL